MTARIPITDVHPVVDCAARPAKAVAGEPFDVEATVFREGHDAVNANVVLRDPRGKAGDYLPMHPLAPGTDRWAATVTPTRPGKWTFSVEGWSDPYGTWRHDAPIKVKAGVDVELMLEEGARLMERAAEALLVELGPDETGIKLLRGTAADLRDERYPAQVRLAAGLSPEVVRLLGRHPLRDMVSATKRYPLTVDRPEPTRTPFLNEVMPTASLTSAPSVSMSWYGSSVTSADDDDRSASTSVPSSSKE